MAAMIAIMAAIVAVSLASPLACAQPPGHAADLDPVEHLPDYHAVQPTRESGAAMHDQLATMLRTRGSDQAGTPRFPLSRES